MSRCRYFYLYNLKYTWWLCILLGIKYYCFFRVSIILPDIIKYKDIAISKLNSMKDKPYVGGYEEKWVLNNSSPVENESLSEPQQQTRKAKKTHTLVGGASRGRPFKTIKMEIIASAIIFLDMRLDSDQERVMESMKEICLSNTPIDFIDASRSILECGCITAEKTMEFSDHVFETFDQFKPDSYIIENDFSVKILQMLR